MAGPVPNNVRLAVDFIRDGQHQLNWAFIPVHRFYRPHERLEVWLRELFNSRNADIPENQEMSATQIHINGIGLHYLDIEHAALQTVRDGDRVTGVHTNTYNVTLTNSELLETQRSF